LDYAKDGEDGEEEDKMETADFLEKEIILVKKIEKKPEEQKKSDKKEEKGENNENNQNHENINDEKKR
jgi:hypothetical protein